MVAVIIGGSGSGKSEFAENMALQLYNGNVKDKSVDGGNIDPKKSLIYIATMEPYGEEGRKRIERHHKLRNGKGFVTMECYTGLEDVRIPVNSTVLLECMSNLVANEFFSKDGSGDATITAVKKGVEELINQSDNLIIVTNNVFDDGFQYSMETLEYMKLLGEVNQWISRQADEVIEVIHGIPCHRR